MANHRKKHPNRSWKGCAMCKPHKRKGQNHDKPKYREVM